MRSPRPTRVYRCQAHQCCSLKQPGDPWVIARVDRFGRMVFEKYRNDLIFATEAARDGSRVLCSENCARAHLARWIGGQITAADQPESAAPAHWDGDRLTCWVSDIYETTTQYGPARIINYRDDGRKCSIYCWKQSVFAAIESTAGRYATFVTVKKAWGEFIKVVGVEEIHSSNAIPSQEARA